MDKYFKQALEGAKSLKKLDSHRMDEILKRVSDDIENAIDEVLLANKEDLDKLSNEDPRYDRLLLNEERLLEIARSIRDVANLPSPLNVILHEWTVPNGMRIRKVSQPFGVIGVVYEARPNVSCDVFSLCFKAGSAIILKGGKEAHRSNEAIVEVIKRSLRNQGEDDRFVTLLPADRAYTAALLTAEGIVDLVIPRGSKTLIDFVRETSTVPVIETGAGICHVYFSEYGDLEKGSRIVENSKCRRVSVCNALDTLLIHKNRLDDLMTICRPLASHDVELYVDDLCYEKLEGNYPEHLLSHASRNSYGMEYLSYKMSIKSVNNTEEAIEHIDHYSSKHSEAIVSEDKLEQQYFLKSVDAACVYVNVSTAFTDGGEFGFGAEIGISTQKMHARGPMGLKEITTYKYEINGDGQIR